MKMSAAARHRTVEQYEAQLKELKTNSKPMINSLTMLAEDCIRQAEVIVEITEKHLRRVSCEAIDYSSSSKSSVIIFLIP